MSVLAEKKLKHKIDKLFIITQNVRFLMRLVEIARFYLYIYKISCACINISIKHSLTFKFNFDNKEKSEEKDKLNEEISINNNYVSKDFHISFITVFISSSFFHLVVFLCFCVKLYTTWISFIRY